MARIVGLGELLWDLFPDGEALGGAPANFCHHLAGLGHRAFIASRVGDDPLGRRTLAELERRGLPTAYVQIDDAHPTGTVPVEVDHEGTPRFSIVRDVAWDYLTPTEELHRLLQQADLTCFGTLAQRSEQSRRTILQLLPSCRGAVLFDANLRHRLWSARLVEQSLEHATIVKVNEQEWSRLVELGLLPAGLDEMAAARSLIARHHLELVCVTRGHRGCRLISRQASAEHPGFEADVVDTVGCGDAFAAAIADGWLAGRSLAEMARRANRLGAWVASHRGATPPHPPS